MKKKSKKKLTDATANPLDVSAPTKGKGSGSGSRLARTTEYNLATEFPQKKRNTRKRVNKAILCLKQLSQNHPEIPFLLLMYPGTTENVELVSKPVRKFMEDTLESQSFLQRFRTEAQSLVQIPQDLRNQTIPADLRRNDLALPTNPTPGDAYLWLVRSFPNAGGLRKAYRRIKYVSDTLERSSSIETADQMFAQLSTLFPILEKNELLPKISTLDIWDTLHDFGRNLKEVTDQNVIGLMQALIFAR